MQCTASLLVALHLVALILLCTTVPSHHRTNVSVPAAAVAVLAVAAIPVLAHCEHTRLYTYASSSGPGNCSDSSARLLVGLFLCVAVLLRAPLVRTHAALYGRGSALVAVEIVLVVFQLLLIALGEVSSGPATADSNGVFPSPEERAGFLGRSFGSWLCGVFVTGYRNKNLSLDDLGPVDTALESRVLETSFGHILPVFPVGKPSTYRKGPNFGCRALPQANLFPFPPPGSCF